MKFYENHIDGTMVILVLLLFLYRTILKADCTLGSCVKQHNDVGLSISFLATQPWVFEINKLCLAFELRLRNLCIYFI